MNETSQPGQIRRGVLAPVVLALVSARPRYGLELVRALSDAGLVTSEGTVYPLLTRLQKAGLLWSEWEIPDNGRPRRIYKVTASGTEELDRFIADWQQFTESVNSIIETCTKKG